MIRALIIDDEHYAREELYDLLDTTHDFEILAQCANAIEGLKAINKYHPDVVFLDIQMPKISGIELLSMLDPDDMPKIVFITAYDEYAVQAFEDNAFDYLLKPIEPKRLNKTIERLKKSASYDYTPIIKAQLELIPCVGLNRILLIPQNEIDVAYSDISGIHILTDTHQATTQLSLKLLEQKTSLIRCHRQYLVNPQKVREIKLLENGLAELKTIYQHEVPVSRRYLKEIKDYFHA